MSKEFLQKKHPTCNVEICVRSTSFLYILYHLTRERHPVTRSGRRLRRRRRRRRRLLGYKRASPSRPPPLSRSSPSPTRMPDHHATTIRRRRRRRRRRRQKTATTATTRTATATPSPFLLLLFSFSFVTAAAEAADAAEQSEFPTNIGTTTVELKPLVLISDGVEIWGFCHCLPCPLGQPITGSTIATLYWLGITVPVGSGDEYARYV